MGQTSDRTGGSLQVVEDFYGEEVSSALCKKIRQTPSDQLVELAHRIASNNIAITNWALHRPQESENLAKRPLFIHDKMYLYGGRDMALTEAAELKHLILHAERFVLPDDVADWAEEALYSVDEERRELHGDWQRIANDLADYIRKSAALSPLARLGSLVLLPSRNYIGIEDDQYSIPLYADYGEALGSSKLIEFGNLVEGLALDDPYLAWVVVNKLGLVADWEYEVHDYDKVTDLKQAAAYVAHQASYYPHYLEGLAQVVYAAYGGTARPDEVRDAVQFNKLCGDIDATPVVSSPLVRNHLLNSAAVILDGGRAGVRENGQALEAAVAYRVPSLVGVSFADLVKLRLNEEIYHDVRRCLESLASSVAMSTMPGNFASYEREVREQANDIVRPTYEKLMAKLKRKGT